MGILKHLEMYNLLHSFQQDCSFISRDHKLNDMLTVSRVFIYNQEVFFNKDYLCQL